LLKTSHQTFQFVVQRDTSDGIDGWFFQGISTQSNIKRFIVRRFFYVVASALIFAFSVRSARALGPVAIINLDSDMCLQPADSTTGAGADIILMPYRCSVNQMRTVNHGSATNPNMAEPTATITQMKIFGGLETIL
jgi:hypothetical protein